MKANVLSVLVHIWQRASVSEVAKQTSQTSGLRQVRHKSRLRQKNIKNAPHFYQLAPQHHITCAAQRQTLRRKGTWFAPQIRRHAPQATRACGANTQNLRRILSTFREKRPWFAPQISPILFLRWCQLMMRKLKVYRFSYFDLMMAFLFVLNAVFGVSLQSDQHAALMALYDGLR